MDKNINILILDDEEYILASLRRVLDQQGYNVQTTTKPHIALSLLKQKSYQLIISDYNMPEMLGTEFLDKVKSLYPKSIRMVLTGSSELKTIQSFLIKGNAVRYLLKPWDNEELKSVIRDSLETYSDEAA